MGLLDWITGANPSAVAASAGTAVVGSIFSGVEALVGEFHLSPADELKFKLALGQLQLQTLQAQVADTQSARQMQMASPSVWPGLLTMIITLGFYGSLYVVITHGLPAATDAGGEAILLLLGSLTTGFMMVLSFWFGSSQGSQNKDQMLWKSNPTDNPQKAEPKLPANGTK